MAGGSGGTRGPGGDREGPGRGRGAGGPAPRLQRARRRGTGWRGAEAPGGLRAAAPGMGGYSSTPIALPCGAPRGSEVLSRLFIGGLLEERVWGAVAGFASAGSHRNRHPSGLGQKARACKGDDGSERCHGPSSPLPSTCPAARGPRLLTACCSLPHFTDPEVMGFPQAHSFPPPDTAAEARGGATGGDREAWAGDFSLQGPARCAGRTPATQATHTRRSALPSFLPLLPHFSAVLSLLFQPIAKKVVLPGASRNCASQLLNSPH